MKKAIHIIALPILAAAVALLSACTTNLPESAATSTESKAGFNELSQRLDELNQRLDKVTRNEETEKTEERYQELKFTFANLGAAGKQRSIIIKQLDDFLVNKKKFDKKSRPSDRKIVYLKTEPWGIDKKEKENIAETVKALADKWTGILGKPFKMPATTKPEEFALRFFKGTHDYNVVSGGAPAITQIIKCVLTYDVKLDAKAFEGDIWVYAPDSKTGKFKLVKIEELGSIQFSVPGIQNISSSVCKPDPKEQGPKEYRHIMVKSKGEPRVAQYYTATYCTDGPGKCEQITYVSGRLTVGKPACPPKDWNKPVREAMENELKGGCVSS